MTPMAWVLGVLTSPLWLGWLYLPWRQWRDHASGRWHPRPLARVTALALLLLWVILLWRAPPELALQAVQATATSSTAWRALPAFGLLSLGPVWGAILVSCPEALRDTLGDVAHCGLLPLGWLQAIGWGLLSLGAVAYVILRLTTS